MTRETLTISRNELILNSRKFETSEIGRGTGVRKAKKGKGSYSRKGKYKKQYDRSDETYDTAFLFGY